MVLLLGIKAFLIKNDIQMKKERLDLGKTKVESAQKKKLKRQPKS